MFKIYTIGILVALFLLACEGSGLLPEDIYDGSGYIPYSKMEAGLKEIARLYPAIVELTFLQDANGEEIRTYEDRPIYYVRVSDNIEQDENEPDVFILVGVHAREWAAIGVGYFLLQHIVRSYKNDETITELVDASEFHIIPIANPDGYVYSWRSNDPKNKYWRKNRRKNGDGSYGVDLNRNWSYQWGYASGEDGNNPQSYVYRGTAAFSEPETRGVRDALAALSDLKLFIDIHSVAQVVLYPWAYRPGEPQDPHLTNTGAALANAITMRHGREHMFLSDFDYYAAGTSQDYVYDEYTVPSFTIETRLEGSPNDIEKFRPPEASVQPTFEEILAGVLAGWDYVLKN